MKHYGDITKIKGYDVPCVNVVCGGSPCQDLSVAGKRAGLAGERSGLFMEQIRIIKEMRNESEKKLRSGGADVDIRHIQPRYMVWENVPGAFTSGTERGADFQAVLEETAKVAEGNARIPRLEKWPSAGCIMGDGWSIAWRVHDAQFWGVPQRRKRISLVADFGGASAPEILFERESMSGNLEQSEQEGQGVAEDFEGRSGEASSYTLKIRGGKEFDKNGKRAGKGALVQTELSGTLGVSQDQTLIDVVGFNRERCGAVCMDDKFPTLQAAAGESGNNKPMVCFEPGAASRVGGHCYEGVAGTVRANAGDNQQAVCYGIGSYDSNAMKSSNPNSGIYEAETSRTLDLNGGNPACNQGGMAVVGFDSYNMNLTGDKGKTLQSEGGGTGVNEGCVLTSVPQGCDVYNLAVTGEVAASLTAEGMKSPAGSGPRVISVEGNGARESHKGNGYAESEQMYTLNSTEQHAVAYEPTLCIDRGGGRQTQTVSTTHDGAPVVLYPDKTGSLCAAGYDKLGVQEAQNGMYVVENHPNDSRVKIREDGVFQTLSGRMGTGGGNTPMVVSAEVFHCTSEEEKVQTLKARDYKDPQIVCEQRMWNGENVAPTLTKNNAGGNQRMPDKDNFNAVVSYGLDRASYNQGANAKFDFMVEEEKIGPALAQGPETVCASICKGTSNQIASDDMLVTNSTAIVRRLTPKECERLQGYPDGWTDIGDWTDSKGKVHKGDSDSPRYKALGNSIALPFWKWMAKRMCAVLREDGENDLTMASLFDGIGGFPLSFAEAGCRPVWASEIEEFPIAVTKIRFPEE